MKWIYIIYVCFLSLTLNAQKSGKYVLQFFGKNDSIEVPFTVLKATYQSQNIGKWQADLDGIIKLDSLNYNPETKFVASSPEMDSIIFGPSEIKVGTITKFYLPDMHYMGTLVITSYKYPLQKLDKKNSDAWYNQQYKSTVDSIKSGSWFTANKQKLTLSYLQYYKTVPELISYPETAKKFTLEETIFFSYYVDAKGYISNLKLEKGNSALLIIQASKVMATLLRIVSENKTQIQLKGDQKIRVVQPIEFQLK